MIENNEEKIELIKKSFELKQEKKYKSAIEMLYKALEFDNNKEDMIEISSQLGDLYLLINNQERALDEFQKVLSLNPNHKLAQQKCFDIYYETKQFNKALKLSTSMCENYKTSKSYFDYIKTLIALDKKQDAIELFNSLNETIKLDTDVLYLIATISENKKEIILKKIIDLDLNHTNANVDMATIEFNRQNYDKVISYCLNINEDHPLALYYLGRIEALKHNSSRAIELYIQAINLDNDKHNFYLDLAKAYIDVSWFDEAMAMVKKSLNFSINIQDTKNLDENYLIAGWILVKQNKIDNAILNLNMINKNSELYNKAQILMQLINLKNKNISTVVIKLEDLIKTEKSDIILLDTLALAYKNLKLYKKAIKIYEQALSFYPNSIYYNIELIDLLIDDKDYEKAEKLINNFISEYENCPEIYNSLARVYYRLKEFDNALNAIEKYLSLDKNNSEAHYFKGLILNDLERYTDAKDSIYEAIKLNPTIAKYYSQMAKSYIGIKEYENALLYAKEAIEIDENEINYKKQAYEISELIGDKEQTKRYKKYLDRYEKVLKMLR